MSRSTAPRGWLLPTARCPNCNAPPPIRIPPKERDDAREELPDAPKQSVQCPVPWCQTVYEILTKHYQSAR